MKNFFTMLLALLFCVASSLAQEFEVDGLRYKIIVKSRNEVELLGGETKEVIEIPETITYREGTYTVSSIGSFAFSEREIIKKCIIPRTVQTIGDGAFCNNYNLEEVVLNEGLHTIGEYAFGDNYALKEIRMPSTVRTISQDAFCNNSNLEEVTLNEGLQTIGNGAFCNNYALKVIQIPSTMRTIGEYAFGDNHNLEVLKLNEGLQTIGNNAFSNNYALKEIRIPSSVTFIGERAFWTEEDNRATISSLATTPPNIKDYAFEGRTNTALHVIQSNVKAYQEAEYWKDFAEIIGDQVYRNRFNTPTITCDNNILTITCKTEDAAIYYTTDGSIPDENAIRYSSPISSINIRVVRAIAITEGNEHSGITDFCNKEYINITDKQGVSYTLMQEVLDGCYYYSVTGRTNEMSNDIIIPADLGGYPIKHIGNKAFASSNIKSITIPESVTSIEEGAFYDCNMLQNVTSKISQPFYVKAFKFHSGQRPVLFVPKNSRKAYKRVRGWDFAIIYEDGEIIYKSRQSDEQGLSYTLKQDSDGSLYYSVTGWDYEQGSGDLEIPTDLGGCPIKAIEIEFQYMGNMELESITIPDGITNIPERMFYGCSNLSSVTLGSGLTSIGYFAYYIMFLENYQ
jgi:hypothetical protein